MTRDGDGGGDGEDEAAAGDEAGVAAAGPEADAKKKKEPAQPPEDAAHAAHAQPEHPEPQHEPLDEAAWEGVAPHPPAADDEDEEDEGDEVPRPKSEADLLEGVVEEDEDEDDDEEDDEDAEEEAEEQRFDFKATPSGIRVKPGVFSSMEGLETELAETRTAVEKFTVDAARAVGANVRPENGHLLVQFPREVPRGVRRKRRLVFELSKMQRELTELAAPGSRFLRELAEMVQPRAPVGVAAAEVGKPLTLFHYRVHMTALHYKFEDVVSVCLDDIGLREDAPDLTKLAAVPVGAAAIEEPDFELLEDAAKRSLLKQVAPKLDELSSAVSAGLEAALKRITRYYGQLREEARLEEAKVRRRIGELNARLWFTEDGLRERKMERERDTHQRSLADIRQRNKHRLEELEAEEAVRLSRESEKHRPKVRLELVGITRVVPRGAAALDEVATPRPATPSAPFAPSAPTPESDAPPETESAPGTGTGSGPAADPSA